MSIDTSRPRHRHASPPQRARMATLRFAAILSLAAVLFQTSGTVSAHAAVAAVPSVTTAAPATSLPQSVGSCPAWYTCTVYFSRSETSNWGNMRFPAVPQYLPWQIKAAYWGATSGLAWFAKQYANRGWCSAYRISLVPWAGQGYTGYACNWW